MQDLEPYGQSAIYTGKEIVTANTDMKLKTGFQGHSNIRMSAMPKQQHELMGIPSPTVTPLMVLHSCLGALTKERLYPKQYSEGY